MTQSPQSSSRRFRRLRAAASIVLVGLRGGYRALRRRFVTLGRTRQVARKYTLDLGATRTLMLRFSPYLREHRQAMIAALLFTIGAAVMELLRPWPMKVIFDGVLVPLENPGALIGWLTGITGSGQGLLAAAALAILAIALIGGFFSYRQSNLIAVIGQGVVGSIRTALYNHIQRLSQSFHDTSSTGDLLARLTGDVRLMQDVLVSSSLFICAHGLVIAGTIAVMLLLDWRLTLVALAILPLLGFVTRKFSTAIKGASRQQRRNESKVAHVMAESLSAIKVVQAHSREAHEAARFAKQNASSLEAGALTARLEAHLDRIVQIILAGGTCAVIWYGVTRVQAGALTPGDLLVFTAYLAGLYRPISRLASIAGRIAKATACGERIIAILDLEPEIQDAVDAKPLCVSRGEIILDGVSFSYLPGHEVLRDVHLRINSGETIAFMSESGSGKSTIAQMILRFYDPHSGSIRIDGQDVRAVTLASLREQVTVLMQESVLFNTSIRENIAYGKLDASEAEIVAAATAARAHDFIMQLPEGYDTVVGERGATLSGGQRQRVAIARALVRNAPIIILDEPLTGLDSTNEATVKSAIGRLIAGRTCIIITHDRATAALADRVFAIREQRLVQTDLEERPAPSARRRVIRVVK